ncbi:MAG: GlsB/YeaQ/YmgE family stress response membrane protein [Tannerellaceae bacterium]|nr:GlsB/YeaQ/YmgE family stress response membrane protein [Tannerellaceae bacterium]
MDLYMGLGIIGTIFVGIFIGFMAGKFFEGRSYTLAINLFIALIGALLGGWIFEVLKLEVDTTKGLIVSALLGAAVFLLVGSFITRRLGDKI